MFIKMPEEPPANPGVDTTSRMLVASGFGAGFGVVTGTVSSVYNETAMDRAKIDPKVITSRSLKTIGTQTGLFAAVGATYVAGSAIAESVRGEQDYVNRMIGACAAGTISGARAGKVSGAVVGCPLFAFISLVVDATGGPGMPKEVLEKRHPVMVAGAKKEHDAHH